jgi:hypothetical protein
LVFDLRVQVHFSEVLKPSAVLTIVLFIVSPAETTASPT